MGASEKSAATFHPHDRPVGDVPPRFLYRDPTKPDPYQALLTQLHEARAEASDLRAWRDIATTAEAVASATPCTCSAQRSRAERAEAVLDRVAVTVAPQWRSVPSDLPPDPVEAFSRGRNWMIDHLRALLDGEVRPEGPRSLTADEVKALTREHLLNGDKGPWSQRFERQVFAFVKALGIEVRP